MKIDIDFQSEECESRSMMKNYQVVKRISESSSPYEFETIKSEFDTIQKAVTWGQRNMYGMPFELRNNGEPLSVSESEELADLL